MLIDRDWSQAELSRRAGVSRSTISKIMSGERGPGSEFCQSVAQAFNMPEEEVFRIAGLLSPDPDIDPMLEEINHKLATLPPDLQEEALNYLNYLIEKQDNKARGNNLDLKKSLGTSNAS